ncbi:hypothetical protein [Exiguobacterium qingdaonense]|uniref:hypothetical protein n=1 Tax=Exiguobacterium qingdaonense TaxID=2751251 RepID=UPI001BE64684|nr:hypothetical protein [Exiguobacterium qingdaonense]
MRWLSSNEADWERRHPVTLLFFLIAHLFVLTNVEDVSTFVIGLVALLLFERRFPWAMLSVLIAFGVVSVFPALFGWDLSASYIWRQLLKLAAFLLGMSWVSRLVRLELLLPLLSRWPRSSSLLYGAWALIPSMERAVRQSMRSHPKTAWQEAVEIGIASQQREPRFAIDPMRRFRVDDGIQLIVIGVICYVSLQWAVALWLIYPYVTKGGIRDAVAFYR